MAEGYESRFPVFTGEATEEERKLSLGEKLKLVDNELRQLYDFCSKAGYTHAEIEQCAQPLFALGKRERRVKWLKRLGYFALIVGFIALLFCCDTTYRQICISGKLLAIKVSGKNLPLFLKSCN